MRTETVATVATDAACQACGWKAYGREHYCTTCDPNGERERRALAVAQPEKTEHYTTVTRWHFTAPIRHSRNKVRNVDPTVYPWYKPTMSRETVQGLIDQYETFDVRVTKGARKLVSAETRKMLSDSKANRARYSEPGRFAFRFASEDPKRVSKAFHSLRSFGVARDSLTIDNARP